MTAKEIERKIMETVLRSLEAKQGLTEAFNFFTDVGQYEDEFEARAEERGVKNGKKG